MTLVSLGVDMTFGIASFVYALVLQIRDYGADEIAGAKELASLLTAAFPGQNIALSDFSHGLVKQPEPGLYELWVPPGISIGSAVRRH